MSPEKPRSHRSREAKKPRVTKPLKPRSHRSQEAKSHEATKAEKPRSHRSREAKKPSYRSRETKKPRATEAKKLKATKPPKSGNPESSEARAGDFFNISVREKLSDFGISGPLLRLGISKTLAGPMDLQFFLEFGRNEILGFLAHGGLLTYREDPKPYEALIPTKADLQSPQALNGRPKMPCFQPQSQAHASITLKP